VGGSGRGGGGGERADEGGGLVIYNFLKKISTPSS
jgi:hypothetical protein